MTTPSAKGLEGKATPGNGEEDSKNVSPREFFWDSITLYVVFAIVALSSIDLVIEFVRQPEVRCFSRNNQTELANYQDYVNEFCYGTSALSNINIFRICSYILGFSIAALHYLWLNHFGGKFAFFFQLVSDISRHRSEETGDYPKENKIIADQLEESFTTFKQNSIFWVYLAKLLLQLLLSIAGVVGIGYYFTRLRFDASFYCPETMEDTLDMTGPWPLTGEHVTCVYTSFPLLELLCIADMALLALAIVLLTASIIWCSASHSKQLGYKDIAVFVFQTGLPSRFFIPNFKVSNCQKSCCCCFSCLYYCLSSIPWLPLRGPKISTDLDFMMMRLFRTDGGLGHVLKEALILKEVKNLNNNDLQKYALHRREQKLSIFKTEELIRRSDVGDLKWIFDKNKHDDNDPTPRGVNMGPPIPHGVYNPVHYGQMPTISHYESMPFGQLSQGRGLTEEKVFRMPDTVRGAVLGFTSYVQTRNLALCLSFGSPSTGFSTALARVFSEVISINFSPYFYNRQVRNDQEDESTKTTDITFFTFAEDVLVNEESKEKFIMILKEACADEEINFILLSPLTKPIHINTMTFLIYLLQDKECLAQDAVLLTMYPLAIAGRQLSTSEEDTEDHQQGCTLKEKEFHRYSPDKFFPNSVTHNVQMVKEKLMVWPKFDMAEQGRADYERPQSADDLSVCVVSPTTEFKMKTKMSFKLFSRN